MEPAYLRLPFLVAQQAEWQISAMVQPFRLLPQQGQVGQGQAVSLEELPQAHWEQPACPVADRSEAFPSERLGRRFLHQLLHPTKKWCWSGRLFRTDLLAEQLQA